MNALGIIGAKKGDAKCQGERHVAKEHIALDGFSAFVPMPSVRPNGAAAGVYGVPQHFLVHP
jgi:hypothetical protein